MENSTGQSQGAASRRLVIAAFAAIYIIWGSTYLGIRFAIETMPPFMMAGARFVMAGMILYGWLRFKGVPHPKKVDWHYAAITGGLMIAAGNGGVTWAEKQVPSGLASLLVGMMPAWLVLFDWLRPNGARPALKTVMGVLVGFSGVAILTGSKDATDIPGANLAATVVLVGCGMTWAIGSLVNRHGPKSSVPLMGVAQQMLAGGFFLTLAGIAAGDWQRFEWQAVSLRSLAAFLYLVVFGSLIGFTAYIWLLQTTAPAKVATCAYINPAIAVLLGCTLGGEQMNARILMAGMAIFLGVMLIVSPSAVTGQAKSMHSKA
jgi:drug/metabolite transporter (DMT)-like permease